MRTSRYLYFLLTIGVLSLGAGCRRPLDRGTPPPTPPTPVADKALIALAFDWSQSGLVVGDMKRATARIYPHDGSAPIEVVLSEPLTPGTVWLPVGSYSVVGLNETTLSKDWVGIDFSGHERYEAFTASARSAAPKATEPLIASVEPLAIASVKQFDVTKEMVVAAPERPVDTIALTPQAVTRPIRVRAKVQNLDNARSVSAQLSGLTTAVALSSQTYAAQTATHSFTLTERTADPQHPHDGTIEAQFNVFLLSNTRANTLSLTFQLLDGTIQAREFEVTQRIIDGVTYYEVVVGSDQGEDPIILPPVPAGYVPVTIYFDWSQSHMQTQNVNHVSAWLYPQNGAVQGAPIELVASGTITSISTQLLPNDYTVVAFNGRTEPTDWSGVRITGTETAASIAGVVLHYGQPAGAVDAEGVDPLVAATHDRFVVAEGSQSVTLQLLPVTRVLTTTIHVTNLDNVRSMTCTLNGLSAGQRLTTIQDVAGTANYRFIPTERTMDPLDKRNGTIKGQLYLFGTPDITPGTYTLDVACTLIDQTIHPVQTFSASGLFHFVSPGYTLDIRGLVLPERPRLPIDGDPNVNPWNPEQNNPLQ